jgi:ParB family chromosome partitioning protein
LSTQSTTSRFVDADPRELIVGANVRLDARLDKSFIASVRERGVLQAVTAYRDEQQRLVVLYGQRRTVAAVEVGCPTIPVLVVEAPQEVDRLGDQVVENDRRAELTTGERLAAFEQMAAFGVSAAQIAKRTGHSKADVATALTVAGSELAKKATQRYDFLTLDQAVVVAEFQDDPEAVTSLVVKARDGGHGFDHLAQRLRDRRAEDAERAQVEAELAAGGLAVVPEPQYGDPAVRLLSRLVDANGERLTPETHQRCPGHGAYIVQQWGWTEASADEPQNDDTTEDDEDDEEGEYSEGPAQVLQWTPQYVCTDVQQHGHQERSYGAASQKKIAADMTDQEREAERVKRRDVIQSNKDWLSATTVRREWLSGFLTRKSAPKTTARFLAGSLARPTLGLANGYGLAYELLGLTGQSPTYGRPNTALSDLIDNASEARAQVVSLALVLAAFEEPLKLKDSWRSAGSDTARYLRFLETCGYTLAAIELRACGQTPQPDEQTATSGGGVA